MPKVNGCTNTEFHGEFENFCQNENYFQIRPPKITALLCPFPALSPAETSLFPRNFAESSIVGYQTTTLTKGANKSFALQFESLENPGQAVRIDNLFPGTTFKAGASWTAADQIWAWDATANNWAKYAYYENKRVTPVVPAGWYKYNFLTDQSFVAVTDSDVVQPGETFLYMRNQSGSIELQMSGLVRDMADATQSFTITKGVNVFMAYPWPVELTIAEISTKATHSNLKAGASWTAADQIWAWDTTANNWAKYAYYENKRVTPVVPAGWYKYNFLTDKSFVAVTDADKVAAGEGFLYIRNQSGTNTITWNAITPAE